jgi:hypothetical protein
MLLLAAGLLGCGKQPDSRHVLILIDVSGSIERSALEQAFRAIDDLVGHLNRGDEIAIIPIMGDADADTSGQIIRFSVPANRQAYDTDLRDFRRKLKTSLAAMQSNAIAYPGSKTDILGSIIMSEQEFQTALTDSRKLLVILSDFIHERPDMDFRQDPRLANPRSAKEFAIQLANTDTEGLKGISVFMGFLGSNEYAKIEHRRREAIREFWLDYMKNSGAQPKFANDTTRLVIESDDKQLRITQ